MKILLPVDGSAYTKRMLAFLSAHDELLGSGHEYLLFTAVPAVPAHAARHLDRALLDDHYADQAQQVLKPLQAFAEQRRWRHRVLQAVGPAADAVAACAEAEHVDLIVMGSHGHSSLTNLVLGSVATGVLARTRVPVLLVR